MSADERGSEIAVLARAPLRVSLAGGGTDLPSYAERYGGLTVSFAIDRYVSVVTFPRSFQLGIRACFEQIEHADSVAELHNPFARAALVRVGVPSSLQIASFSDVPSGTGVGGSGAFTVALLHALRFARRPERIALAEEASAIEIEDLARPVGKHDHYMAALGGLRVLHFERGEVRTETIEMTAAVRRYFDDHLLLFYTGIGRDAGQVLAAQQRRTLESDGVTLGALHKIKEIADEMVSTLRSGAIERVGPLLLAHWQQKRTLSETVSSPRIDCLIDTARHSGADGVKLLGAGGGGFLLVSVPAGAHASIRSAMFAVGARELLFGYEGAGTAATCLAV